MPLKALYIEANIDHTLCEFKMHQFYENAEEVALETEFLFPVDPEAAVSGITVDFGEGKVVECQLY